jgi:hypothetical protein
MDYLLSVVVAAVVAVSILPAWGQDVPAGGDAYPPFEKFCHETFGGRHEPATYRLPGDKLAFLEDGAWQHVSENSATIAVETNLPAKVWIHHMAEPGEFEKVNVPEDARYHYVHVLRLRDLKPGTPYRYVVNAIDERGNMITGKVGTITPKAIDKAVYLPNEQQPKPPFELNQGGTTYVLKENVTAAGYAFAITAPDVTLDLNGFTATYNNDGTVQENAEQKAFGALAAQGVQGVRCGYATRGANAKIFNGTIKQGGGGGAYGSVPIQARCAEIAGVEIDYVGKQVSGIEGEIGKAHHNVITDRGTEMSNRHQGVQAINGGADVHHNLIRRVRQRGINGQSGAKVYRNEIYVDSCATNSFGMMFYKSKDCVVTENRVFGGGYLAIGIGTVSAGVANIQISKNFIHLQSTAPDNRWAEYGDQSGAYCVRVTWGGDNIEYADNVMISKARDGGMARGVWFCPDLDIKDVSFRRNYIRVLADNDKSGIWGAIVISGKNDPAVRPGLFEDNTVISNFCNVRLGEDYGAGVNAHFVNNTFIREGQREAYATITCGYGNTNNSGSVFAGSKFEGGAGYDQVKWEGTGKNDFATGRAIRVKTSPGATVSLVGGEAPSSVIADKAGVATVMVVEQAYTPADKKDIAAAEKITATLDGKTAEAPLPAGGELTLTP